MYYTGTLIDDLMAMVERAEQRAQSRPPMLAQPMTAEPMLAAPLLAQSWIASLEQNDSQLIGVA